MKFEITGYYIELTNKCNAKCYYCYNDSGYGGHEKIEFSLLKNFLSRIKDDNVKLVLSGGEPFLYKDIISLIELIKVHRLKCTIITNGTCIDDSIIKLLNDDIFSLQLSVNSLNAELHDSITGISNSFNRILSIMKNIKRVSAETKVIVRFLVQKENLSELSKIPYSEIYRLADRVDFDIIKFSGRSKEIVNITPFNSNDLYNIYHILSKLEIDYAKIRIPKIMAICKFCGNESFIKVFPRIDCDGNVYPCNLFADDLFCVGNIYKSSMREIFSDSNPLLGRFISQCVHRRKNLLNCKQCFAKEVCYGGCPGMSSKLGDFYIEDPYCMLRKELFLNKLNQIIKR